jgi:hypothetical protein
MFFGFIGACGARRTLSAVYGFVFALKIFLPREDFTG